MTSRGARWLRDTRYAAGPWLERHVEWSAGMLSPTVAIFAKSGQIRD